MYVFAAGLLLTGCGEMFELDEENPDQPQMKIDRTTIDIMVGDTYTFNVVQAPADAKDQAVAWTSGDTKVATFSGDVLRAVAPGHTTVTVEWLSAKLKSTCAVTVIPLWQASTSLYPHDMMVYANVTVGGRPLDGQCVVAAFSEDTSDPLNPVSELRGVGRLLTEHGVTYLAMRVFSPDDSGEDLILRCYDRQRMLVTECEERLYYSPSGYGTLSDLYSIDFD